MSYLARLKQIESEKDSHHAHDTEPSKPSKAPFEPFAGKPLWHIEEKNIVDAEVFNQNTVTMTAKDEVMIRTWMACIEETDAQIIGDYLDSCRNDVEAREYFLKRARELSEPLTDDVAKRCKYYKARG